MGNIELIEVREADKLKLARKEKLAQMERDRTETIRRESELLLMMLDELVVNTEKQKRGYLLQDLLNRTFDLHAIPVVSSFTRNKGGEQIDGAFKLEG